jgi:predicted PurR-regulated permease PerM
MHIRLIALLATATIALYVCWLMLLPFIKVLAWAVVLVIVFYPIHRRIATLTNRPGWSALLSTVFVIVAILLPTTLVTVAVINEIGEVARNIQGFFQSLLDPNSPVTGRILRWLGKYVDINQLNPQEYLLERINSISSAIASRTWGLVGDVLGTVVQIFFIVFTMYYLFRDG